MSGPGSGPGPRGLQRGSPTRELKHVKKYSATILEDASGRPSEPQLLIRVTRQLTVGEYEIELLLVNKQLRILAHEGTNPEALLIDVSEEQTAMIFNAFQHNYLQLANAIDICDKKLVIVPPRVPSSHPHLQMIIARPAH